MSTDSFAPRKSSTDSSTDSDSNPWEVVYLRPLAELSVSEPVEEVNRIPAAVVPREPRRSERINKGKHSNPFHLPRSAIVPRNNDNQIDFVGVDNYRSGNNSDPAKGVSRMIDGTLV